MSSEQDRLPLVGALVASVMMSACAQAALVFTATEDNNVLKASPSVVQGALLGNDTTFSVKEATSSQGNTRIGFIKFNLSTLPVSLANEGILSITSSGAATSDYVLRAYALNSGSSGYNWTESTITYNNRPALSASVPYVDSAAATIIGNDYSILNTAANGTTYSFSFANLENYRQTLDNSLTVIIVVTSQVAAGSGFNFHSSESLTAAFAPQLSVVPGTSQLGTAAHGDCRRVGLSAVSHPTLVTCF